MSDATSKDKKNDDLKICDDYKRNTKSKLSNAGYNTPRELAFSTVMDLAEKLKVSQHEAEVYNAWALQKLGESHVLPLTFSSASDNYLSKKNLQKLTTGSNALDKLLGGGIEFEAITQIYGPSGSGKTQFSYSLCVEIQQHSEQDGIEGKAILVDTENKFTSERIAEIAHCRMLYKERVLKNIVIVKTVNSIHLEEVISKIPNLIEEDNKIKIVIIDTIINHYRQEFTGRQSLPERQSRLGRVMGQLQKIAQLYKIAVLITNQVSTSGDSYSRDKHVPAGGNVLTHSTKHLIYFDKLGINFLAKVVNSPSLQKEEIRFSIDKSGVTDPPVK